MALADAGADVILSGRELESLEATVADIRAFGREAVIVQADMGNAKECEQACQRVLDENGPIDILLNNVGGRLIDIPAKELPLEQWQKIDLNLMSTFLCTKIIGGAMLKRETPDRVINIASMSGMIANRGAGGRCYETSKAAIIQFTRATAADWASREVTVNAICPGGFKTAPNQKWSRENPEVIESFNTQIPMEKFGEPEELGPLAVYLASDASRYMTGAALLIDGGYTLWCAIIH
ncbi:MAG: SDR family oxidoreductase [Verrucomicrobiales bacterium]|nr:SDR family oxidoreductase [Verrucomicrobiales bacterium]